MKCNNFKRCISFLILLYAALTTGQAKAGQAVWIDTDPACGHTKTDDVDDCWALLLGLHSKALEIRGISTLFGNGSGKQSYRTATQLVRRFGNEGASTTIHRGADRALILQNPQTNEANQALAKALTREPLTIIALGPLTNIATLILKHPEHIKNIKQVVAIAGQRPGSGFGFFPGNSRLFHLHDLNFHKDVAAFEVVLRSSVPVTLVPYEVGSKISIQPDDLAQLNKGGSQSQWLSSISKPWLDYWQTTLQTKGFFPFDSLAIGFVIMPSLFTCENIPSTIQRKRALFVVSRDKLLVSHEFSRNRFVKYCYDINPDFKSKLIEMIK